ncbi:MAG: hypothetical protein ACYTG2_04205 [Planctomycetota bacterium]|jgi:hypothetical protein
MNSPAEETTPPSLGISSQQEALHWMTRAFIAWLFVYMVLQGQDGYFARTVDRISAGWVTLLFLNIPLQILLTLVTSGCAGSERPAVLRMGLWVGATNGVFILVHIILSVATA